MKPRNLRGFGGLTRVRWFGRVTDAKHLDLRNSGISLTERALDPQTKCPRGDRGIRRGFFKERRRHMLGSGLQVVLGFVCRGVWSMVLGAEC